MLRKGRTRMSVQQRVPKGTQGETGNQNPDTSAGRANPGEPGAGASLTRVTANFTPRAVAALEFAAAKTGDSKTDVLNRSVMVYQVFLELIERSGGGAIRVSFPDGTEEN